MIYCSLLVLNIFGEPVQNPVVNNCLLVKLFFGFECQLVLLAGVESLPTIENIVQVTLY
jgi:hypothetical protein